MGFTDKVVYIYVVYVAYLIGLCVSDHHNDMENYIRPSDAMFAEFMVIQFTVFILMIKGFFVAFFKAQKTSLEVQCSFNKYIGYGGILFVLFWARLGVFAWAGIYDVYSAHTGVTISALVTCFMFYFLFAAGAEEHCYIKSKGLLSVFDFGNAAFSLLLIWPAVYMHARDEEANHFMALFHLQMFPLCAVSCREVAAVLTNSLVMKTKEKAELEGVNVEKEKAMEQKKEDKIPYNYSFINPLAKAFVA